MQELEFSGTNKFPTNPSDGQIFVDPDGTRLFYNSKNNKWELLGTNANIDLSGNNKTGLLDARHKVILDSMAMYPGAFGIVLNKPTNKILQGDVELKSTSIDIDCVETVDSTFDGRIVDDVGSIINFVFSLKEDYLNNICMDFKPPIGSIGRTGQTGFDGIDGYGNGPVGYDGEIGPNATKLMRIRNIIYEEVDELSKKAIVDIELIDRGKGPFFKIIESDKTLTDNEPAKRLIVDSVSRDLIFNSKITDENCNVSIMDDWDIIKTGDDQLPTDIHMLRLSDSETEDHQTFSSIRLSEYIRSVIDHYQNKIAEIDKEWSLKSKLHIEEIDKTAREILSGLSNELARCESTLPATEFGITFKRCRLSSPNSLTTLKVAGNRTIGNINSSGKNWEIVS